MIDAASLHARQSSVRHLGMDIRGRISSVRGLAKYEHGPESRQVTASSLALQAAQSEEEPIFCS